MKCVVGYEGLYKIAEDGTIHNSISGRTVKHSRSNFGYSVVGLRKDGVARQFGVHRLVATTYIHKEYDHYEVNHIDGNKQNNHVSNLEWVSRQDNLRHASETGLKRKVKPELAKKIREEYNEYKNKSFIARKYGLSRNTVKDVIDKTGTYVGS